MPHARRTQSLFAPLTIPDDGELADREPLGAGPNGAEQGGAEQGGRQPRHGDQIPTGGSEPPPSPTLHAELPRTYVCPGESHAIPRPVHLARLAAFYPNCRHCEHRTDTGHLPRSMVGRLEQSARRGEQFSPFRGEGIRGAYLNQFTRKTAARIAAAVADRLWTDRPLIGRTDWSVADEAAPLPSNRRSVGPTVVIGQDSRASSPDLCVGISTSLRTMGCEVVDVGRVSGPCLTFAVEHLQAEAGLYVTGSGCPLSWTGIDIVGAGGIPWSTNGTLEDIERRYNGDVPRPTRRGGSQRFFDASVPYRASLLKHFQELRPLTVVCSCSESTIFDSLVPLFDGLPCKLVPLESGPLSNPREATGSDSPVVSVSSPPLTAGPLQSSSALRANGNGTPETRVAAVKAKICELGADCGVLVADDGGSLQLFDRQGLPVPPAELLRRLLTASGPLRPATPVAIGPRVDDECRAVLAGLGAATESVEEGAEAMARGMQEHAMPLGIETGGRFWFRDMVPRCDAALALGQLLRSIDVLT